MKIISLIILVTVILVTDLFCAIGHIEVNERNGVTELKIFNKEGRRITCCPKLYGSKEYLGHNDKYYVVKEMKKGLRNVLHFYNEKGDKMSHTISFGDSEKVYVNSTITIKGRFSTKVYDFEGNKIN